MLLLSISRVAVISKEGHDEAKDVARSVARILLGEGVNITSFPNLHMKGVDHVPKVSDVNASRVDMVITVSGDGTLLRMLRLLDSSVPCLCVNVGGRGIMAEIKPSQVKNSMERLVRGDYDLESRSRISAYFKKQVISPALNEVYALRQSVTRTPVFTIDLGDEFEFTQRMDGVIVSTPTGSTGHSYSYKSPFMDGALGAFLITPVGSITGFPPLVKKADTRISITANSALQLVIDGQEVFSVEPGSKINLKRHERDAVFVRFGGSGSFRQLKNLGFA